MRERAQDRRERADRVYRRLEMEYPDAHCALNHRNAFELTVATILSAQCTDERVNQVTPALFRAFPDPESLAQARQEEVEALVHSTGFFRSKAKNLIGMAEAVVRHHGGEIPASLDALVQLPGVGRKTANVVLGNAFGVDEGVVVDTHVKRLSNRLGFSGAQDPIRVERDLVALFPRERWTMLSHVLIFHGRARCNARKPDCGRCPVWEDCPEGRRRGVV
jgi:endonuclease III